MRGTGSLYDPTWIISLLRLPVFTPALPLKHQQIPRCSRHFLTMQSRASDTTYTLHWAACMRPIMALRRPTWSISAFVYIGDYDTLIKNAAHEPRATLKFANPTLQHLYRFSKTSGMTMISGSVNASKRFCCPLPLEPHKP